MGRKGDRNCCPYRAGGEIDVLGAECMLRLPEAWSWKLKTERRQEDKDPPLPSQCRARNWHPRTSKLGCMCSSSLC